VQCCLKGGVPAFVPFTVTFSASSGAVAGAGLLYAFGHDTNAAVAASYNPAGGASTVTALGPGEWLVRLPGPGPAAQTGGVQVTAANPAKPAVCDVAGRARTPSQTRCWSPPWVRGQGLQPEHGAGHQRRRGGDRRCELLPAVRCDGPTQSPVSYDTNS
jgi:hypothetical protein